eukprot:TRINITY_DN9740_c0_g1_i2.p2 TRINITY_DN9740_c0_g1~~TRINITY_DN9740_c0_g1_i2.p2  ORF type:complete len:152 (+),score=11.92 TRINITY_DN9740_c0_g1_i2:36-491(+)
MICVLLEGVSLAYIFYFFFFQAEDGIRDHAQSRGLGDVYKRQVYHPSIYYPFIFFSFHSYDFLFGFLVLLYHFLSLFNQFSQFFTYFHILSRIVAYILLYTFPSHPLYILFTFIYPMYSASVSYTHLTLPTICSVQISVVAVPLKKKSNKV